MRELYMVSKKAKDLFYKQGYRIAGNHSAVKTCLWCKKALRDEGPCYKENFYGIKSHRCVQMTPSLSCCNLRCVWCWRAVEFTDSEWSGPVDRPKDIIEGCLAGQKELLTGFKGFDGVNKKLLSESAEPSQFAISLIGEPTLYPKLPELIDEINSRGATSFVVSNGTRPVMIKKLLKHQPTQMYITLPAPNKELFKKCCRPLKEGVWESIQESLSLLHKFKRSVVRLTLVKGLNMVEPEQYAKILAMAKPDFVECKAYMFLGLSRKRLEEENMPFHKDVKVFAKKVNNHLGYTVAGEASKSRVVLLSSGKKNLRID